MAVHLVNKEPFIDTGFILMRESKDLPSPVAVLNFEYYDSQDNLAGMISPFSDRIQCLVGKGGIPFGTSHSPRLWDYADNVDTLDFLLKKHHPKISFFSIRQQIAPYTMMSIKGINNRAILM